MLSRKKSPTEGSKWRDDFSDIVINLNSKLACCLFIAVDWLGLKNKKKPKGRSLFPNYSSYRGSADSVRTALQNIREKGLIKSDANDNYESPVISESYGEVLTTAEEVAKVMA